MKLVIEKELLDDIDRLIGGLEEEEGGLYAWGHSTFAAYSIWRDFKKAIGKGSGEEFERIEKVIREEPVHKR